LRPTRKSTNPTGNRVSATTSEPPGARPQRRMRSSPSLRARGRHSTGTRSPTPTPTPSGIHPQLRLRRSTHSRGSRDPAATSAHPGARPERRVHNSPTNPGLRGPRPTGTRSPAPTPTPPGIRSQLRCAGPLIPGTVLTPQPPQHIQVPPPCGECATVHVLVREVLAPRTPLLPRPHQRCQVPALGCCGARRCIPRCSGASDIENRV
jgi:hypothetical protein